MYRYILYVCVCKYTRANTHTYTRNNEVVKEHLRVSEKARNCSQPSVP